MLLGKMYQMNSQGEKMLRKIITLIDFAIALVRKKRKKKDMKKKKIRKIRFKKAKKLRTLFCRGNERPRPNPLAASPLPRPLGPKKK